MSNGNGALTVMRSLQLALVLSQRGLRPNHFWKTGLSMQLSKSLVLVICQYFLPSQIVLAWESPPKKTQKLKEKKIRKIRKKKI